MNRENPLNVAFLLIPGFALLSYSAAAEPLRAANELSGRELYRWRHLSHDGRPAWASGGVAIQPDGDLSIRAGEVDILFVCAGGNPAQVENARLFKHLHRLARGGVTMGGISGGPFILARAGLLEGRRCTVHWEYADAFAERFPDVVLTRSLFELDRDRFTCAGAIAALDMMCALIARDHGAALGTGVSDWFLHTHIRGASDPSRMDLRLRMGITDARVAVAIGAMEANIENPLSRQGIADACGISVRQLERMFSAQVGCGMHRHYLRLRLVRARRLLRETPMPVSAVAVACGFTSSAHFSQTFGDHFGMTPRETRRVASRGADRPQIMVGPPADA